MSDERTRNSKQNWESNTTAQFNQAILTSYDFIFARSIFMFSNVVYVIKG